jgi:hypothetical protein
MDEVGQYAFIMRIVMVWEDLLELLRRCNKENVLYLAPVGLGKKRRGKRTEIS